MGSNTIVQGALKSILEETPESFYNQTLEVIEANAKLAYDMLSMVPGLKPIMPEVTWGQSYKRSPSVKYGSRVVMVKNLQSYLRL